MSGQLRPIAPEILEPSTPDEAASMVRDAEASGRTLVPSGLGCHLGPAGSLPEGAAVLSLKKLSKVLRYEPGDFTVGVQAGIPLDELKSVLAGNGQEIPMDFPRSPRGTAGGAIAQNRVGPRRGRNGSLRNHLIGISGLRGGGRAYKAGGMVVKNVAGYDVAKLLVGSRGTLGPILEANFKLRAIPAARSARRARLGSPAAAWRLVQAVRERGLEPAALLVLDPGASASLDSALGEEPRPAWTAFWLFEGNAGAVRWLEAQADRLPADAGATGPGIVEGFDPIEGERCGAALEHLASLREPQDPGDLVLEVIALPSEAGTALSSIDGALRSSAPAGNGEAGRRIATDASCGTHAIRLHGADGMDGADGAAGEVSEPAARLLDSLAAAARGLQGRLQVLSGPPAAVEAVRRLFPDPLEGLAERVRRVFDPRGIFSRRPAAEGGS